MKTRNMIITAMFAALICISAYIVIPLPFSPVPITLQTLFVMMAGLLLPVTYSGLAVLIYLLLGAVGLPVFSGGASGIGSIVGPTGGYLIGFLVGSMVISMLVKSSKNKFAISFVSAIVGGIVVVYAFGVIWLAWKTDMGIQKAFVVGALPFLLGDFVKAFVATFVAVPLNKFFEQTGYMDSMKSSSDINKKAA